MAEAPASDAIVTMKDQQIPKLSDEQKWEVTHQSIDLLMKNIWEKPDDEYDTISAFQKKSNEFLEHQLQTRKVHSSHVAPERQGGIRQKFRLGAPVVTIFLSEFSAESSPRAPS